MSSNTSSLDRGAKPSPLRALRPTRFSPEQAVEALLLVVPDSGTDLCVPGSPPNVALTSLEHAVSVLYLADALFFEHYGFLASGDTYVARQRGPWPLYTAQLLDAADATRYPEYWTPERFSQAINGAFQVWHGRWLQPLRGACRERLAQAYQACLDASRLHYYSTPCDLRGALVRDTRWAQARETAQQQQSLCADHLVFQTDGLIA